MGKRIKRPVERHRYWTEWGGQTGRIAEWHGQQRIATSEEQRAEAEGDRGGAGADRLGPDQRVPQQRLGGRIHGVHHGLLDVGGFGAGVGGRTAPQRAHELVMKTRDLSTDALKIPGICPQHRRDDRRHPIRGRGRQPNRGWRRRRSGLIQCRANAFQIPGGRRYHVRRHGEKRHSPTPCTRCTGRSNPYVVIEK